MDFSDLLTGNDVPQKARFSNSEWKRMFGNRIPAEVSVFRDGVRRGVFGENAFMLYSNLTQAIFFQLLYDCFGPVAC